MLYEKPVVYYSASTRPQYVQEYISKLDEWLSDDTDEYKKQQIPCPYCNWTSVSGDIPGGHWKCRNCNQEWETLWKNNPSPIGIIDLSGNEFTPNDVEDVEVQLASAIQQRFSAVPSRTTIQSYKEAEALLSKSRDKNHLNLIHASTSRYRTGGSSIDLIRFDDRLGIVYNGNEIVSYYPDGRIKIDSCGWYSPTTSSYIDRFAPVRTSVSKKHETWHYRIGETGELKEMVDGTATFKMPPIEKFIEGIQKSNTKTVDKLIDKVDIHNKEVMDIAIRTIKDKPSDEAFSNFMALLDHGVKPSKENLDTAIWLDLPNVTKMLVKYGDFDKETFNKSLEDASLISELDMVKFFIEKGADDITNAVIHAHSLEVFKYLVEKYGVDVRHKDILKAIITRANIMDYAIDRIPAPEIKAIINDNSLLVYAIKEGVNSDIVKQLIDLGADVHGDNEGAIKEALKKELNADIETIQLLLDHGAVPDTDMLMFALNLQKEKAAKFIGYLTAKGMVIKDAHMIKAFEQDNIEVIRAVVEAGGNIWVNNNEFLIDNYIMNKKGQRLPFDKERANWDDIYAYLYPKTEPSVQLASQTNEVRCNKCGKTIFDNDAGISDGVYFCNECWKKKIVSEIQLGASTKHHPVDSRGNEIQVGDTIEWKWKDPEFSSHKHVVEISAIEDDTMDAWHLCHNSGYLRWPDDDLIVTNLSIATQLSFSSSSIDDKIIKIIRQLGEIFNFYVPKRTGLAEYDSNRYFVDDNSHWVAAIENSALGKAFTNYDANKKNLLDNAPVRMEFNVYEKEYPYNPVGTKKDLLRYWRYLRDLATLPPPKEIQMASPPKPNFNLGDRVRYKKQVPMSTKEKKRGLGTVTKYYPEQSIIMVKFDNENHESRFWFQTFLLEIVPEAQLN